MVRVEELDPGDENKVGSRYLIEWRSRLPYPVEFEFTVDRVERPRLMEGRAAASSTGTGRWRLFEQDGVTAVTYEWNVATTKRVDEPARAVGPAGVRLEPRLGDDARRRGPGAGG